MKTAKNIELPNLPEGLEGLGEIAVNLWWTFDSRGANLFRLVNPYLWKTSRHNPIKMLKLLSKNELNALLKNELFMKEYKYVYAIFQNYLNKRDFQGQKPLPIAYFCAEYGLHHSLPIYSGGLGFLAGDILKESSDMNIPIVGVGFMYANGYVRQIIGTDGWQNGTNETIIKDETPIKRVFDEEGNHIIVQVPFIEPAVWVAIWKVEVGRVNLYLLDTDIEQNDPWDREISSRLYTSDLNQRLRQEIVLGIGGYAVLERLGIKYSILHLNEGHPAFALWERVRYFKEQEGYSFDDALQKVKSTSIFTTHTPLQAATDVYSFAMINKNFENYYKRLGISKEQFLSFGINPDNPSAGFNMTTFAMRMCKHKNAVSKKHQKVTQNIWKNLLQTLPKEEQTIEYITNGIHLCTWFDKTFVEILNRFLGEEWIEIQDHEELWNKIDDIDDRRLWKLHYQNKVDMMNFIRERVRKKWSQEAVDPLITMAEGVMLDPDVLTIGFARRMTAYKRPYLILQDLARLERIVTNEERPVQIIFAGKAHPADYDGKRILQNIFKVCEDRKFQGRIAFVEDYGEEVAKYLVRGCDVWLNNPRVPLEACGTSGMKASINGTLHLSVSDGWWLEGYNGKNGWQFGKEPSDDVQDANELYDILEKEIIPLYYSHDDDIPTGWVQMMKEAIKSVAPHFSARRMMREYLEKFYRPISKEIDEQARTTGR